MKRDLEDRTERLEALRVHLNEGAKQAKEGEFVEFRIADTMARARKSALK